MVSHSSCDRCCFLPLGPMARAAMICLFALLLSSLSLAGAPSLDAHSPPLVALFSCCYVRVCVVCRCTDRYSPLSPTRFSLLHTLFAQLFFCLRLRRVPLLNGIFLAPPNITKATYQVHRSAAILRPHRLIDCGFVHAWRGVPPRHFPGGV